MPAGYRRPTTWSQASDPIPGIADCVERQVAHPFLVAKARREGAYQLPVAPIDELAKVPLAPGFEELEKVHGVEVAHVHLPDRETGPGVDGEAEERPGCADNELPGVLAEVFQRGDGLRALLDLVQYHERFAGRYRLTGLRL